MSRPTTMPAKWKAWRARVAEARALIAKAKRAEGARRRKLIEQAGELLKGVAYWTSLQDGWRNRSEVQWDAVEPLLAAIRKLRPTPGLVERLSADMDVVYALRRPFINGHSIYGRKWRARSRRYRVAGTGETRRLALADLIHRLSHDVQEGLT